MNPFRYNGKLCIVLFKHQNLITISNTVKNSNGWINFRKCTFESLIDTLDSYLNEFLMTQVAKLKMKCETWINMINYNRKGAIIFLCFVHFIILYGPFSDIYPTDSLTDIWVDRKTETRATFWRWNSLFSRKTLTHNRTNNMKNISVKCITTGF